MKLTHEFNMFLQDKNYPLFNRSEYESLHKRLDDIRHNIDITRRFVSKRTQESSHKEIESIQYILNEYESEFRKWTKEKRSK